MLPKINPYRESPQNENVVEKDLLLTFLKKTLADQDIENLEDFPMVQGGFTVVISDFNN